MADTKTTLVNPNYSYTGQSPRQVRPDEQYIAPTLQLGGKRTAAPVTGDQTQYGRPGQGGEQMFFTREAPDPLQYAAAQKPMPVSPDKAGAATLADQFPDPGYSGQNPGGPRTPAPGGPVARGNPGVGQTQPASMFSPTVDQVASHGMAFGGGGSKRPSAIGHVAQTASDDGGFGAAVGGLAQLGGAIGGGVRQSNEDFDAATRGAAAPGGAPPAAGGWRGKMSDAVNNLFGGHDRKSIEYARDAGKGIQAAGPGQIDLGQAPNIGDASRMGQMQSMFDAAPDAGLDPATGQPWAAQVGRMFA